jgi:hypothetical protein
MAFDAITFSGLNGLKAPVGSILQVPNNFSSDTYLDSGSTFYAENYPDLANVVDKNKSLNLDKFKQVALIPSQLQSQTALDPVFDGVENTAPATIGSAIKYNISVGSLMATFKCGDEYYFIMSNSSSNSRFADASGYVGEDPCLYTTKTSGDLTSGLMFVKKLRIPENLSGEILRSCSTVIGSDLYFSATTDLASNSKHFKFDLTQTPVLSVYQELSIDSRRVFQFVKAGNNMVAYDTISAMPSFSSAETFYRPQYSLDSGLTWNAVDPNSSSFLASGGQRWGVPLIATDGTNFMFFGRSVLNMISTNGGKTWSSRSNPYSSTFQPYGGTYWNPISSRYLTTGQQSTTARNVALFTSTATAISAYSGTVLSTDSKILQNSNNVVMCVWDKVLSTTVNYVEVSTDGGITFTRKTLTSLVDTGQTWQIYDSQTIEDKFIITFYYNTGATGLAALNLGLYSISSSDNGTTWSSPVAIEIPWNREDLPGPIITYPQPVWDPTKTTFSYNRPIIDGNNIIMMQVSTNSTTATVTVWNGIISRDSGATWENFSINSTTPLSVWRGLFVIKANRYLAWGQTATLAYKLFLSENLTTWQEIDATSAGLSLVATVDRGLFAVTNKNILFTINSNASTVYISTDYGATWTAKATSTTLTGTLRVGAFKSVMIIAVGTVASLFSIDNGNSWSTCTQTAGSAIVNFVANSKYCVMTTSGSSYFASEDGIFWTTKTLPYTTTGSISVINDWFVIILNKGGRCIVSSDLLDWQLRTIGAADSPFLGTWITGNEQGINNDVLAVAHYTSGAGSTSANVAILTKMISDKEPIELPYIASITPNVKWVVKARSS